MELAAATSIELTNRAAAQVDKVRKSSEVIGGTPFCRLPRGADGGPLRRDPRAAQLRFDGWSAKLDGRARRR
jgi:hypothetical protein